MKLNKTNIKKVFNKNGLKVIGIEFYRSGKQANITTIDDCNIYRQYVITKEEFEAAIGSMKTDYVMFACDSWYKQTLFL